MTSRIFNIIQSQSPRLGNEKRLILSRGIEHFPQSLDLRHLLLPVRDQGKTEKCAGYVGACIKEYQEREISKDKMSADYIYYHKQDPSSDKMSVQNLMDVLKVYGCVREQDMIENKDMKKLEEIGKNFTISSYARCESVQAVVQALNHHGVCMIAVPIYKRSAKETYSMWKPFNNTDEKVGGHAMVICGYLLADSHIKKFVNVEIGEQVFILRNSWGSDWGDKGYTYMSFNDFSYVWDVYVTTDNTTDISKIPQLINTNIKQPSNKKCCIIS